jgi:hypothetical protein
MNDAVRSSIDLAIRLLEDVISALEDDLQITEGHPRVPTGYCLNRTSQALTILLNIPGPEEALA